MQSETKLFDELDLESHVSKPAFEAGKKLYLSGAVTRLDREKTILQGKVTEGAKIWYPEVAVKHTRLACTCTCSYDQGPVCPHCVALGLAHIYGLQVSKQAASGTDNAEYVERFLYELRDAFLREPEESDVTPGLMLDINVAAQTYSLFFFNRKDNTIIAQPETVYHKILGSPSLQRAEKALIGHFVQRDSWAFFAPLSYQPIAKGLAEILNLFSDVTFYNPSSLEPYRIEKEPLKLQFEVAMKEPAIQVTGQLTHRERLIPLSETLYIEGLKCYIYWNMQFFPVTSELYKEFFPLLARNPELRLQGDSIPIFLGEVLPVIPRDHFSVKMDRKAAAIEVINLQPDVLYAVREQANALTVTITYDYRETAVSDSLLSDSKYYHLTGGKRQTYIKKDPFAEKNAQNILFSAGFTPVDNHFTATGQTALGWLATVVPVLPDNYTVSGLESLSTYRLDPHPVTMQLHLTRNENMVDIAVRFSHLGSEVAPVTVHKHLRDGNPYIHLKDRYIRLPIEDFDRLRDVLKNVPVTRQSDLELSVPSTYSHLLMSVFRDNVVWDEKDDFFRQLEQGPQASEAALPELKNITLRPYQVQGYAWLRFLASALWGGILADDMGLGKTIQTLALLAYTYQAAGRKAPSLIIAPTSVLFNWEREISRFTTGLRALPYYGAQRHEALKELKKYQVILSTYGTVRRDIELLRQHRFHYVILDEAQNIKNPQSQTAQAIKQLQGDNRLALTGTPVENNLSELWSVFDFIMPGFLGNRERFEREYEYFLDSEKHNTALNTLKARIRPFILRRTKVEVATELPPKIEEVLYCTMDEETGRAYRSYRDKLRSDIMDKIRRDGLHKSRMAAFTAMLRLRQYCCHPHLVRDTLDDLPNSSAKFETLTAVTPEILSGDHKILVFSQFTSMLAIIRKWLTDQAIEYTYLDGSTRNRAAVVDTFNNDPGKKIFLISLKAGGTGLNLTAADYVIHYDPWWNPAVEAQATDRAYRIGQKRTVFSYKLITEGTIEERILSLQQEKQELFDALLSDQADVMHHLSEKDIEFLLS